MSNKLYLSDRVELHSVFANTSNMTAATFWSNNSALSCTISKDDINPPVTTTTTNIYIVGVNQQTNKECIVQWTNFASTTEFTVSDIADWDYGYYRIYVRQYQTITNGTTTNALANGSKYYDLTKKPIFWNKSPLQFMTYINSGSYEIGCPKDEYGNENNNVTVRKLITISKPFFIQRTHITRDLFNKVFQAIDSTAYNSYSFSNKGTFNNFPMNYVCHSRYYPAGYWGYYQSSWKSPFYANDTDLAKATGSNVTTYGGAGKNPPTVKSLNECPTYMLNSYGRDASGSSTLVAATRSFAEYFMDVGYSPDTSGSPLSGSGWHFNIPTEAQWEYACRAGTLTGFNNGVNMENRYPSSNAQTNGQIPEQNIDEVAWWYRHGNTVSASAMLKPNKWGLYDMHGLLFEWIKDYSGMNYNAISGDVYTTDGSTLGKYAGSPAHLSGSEFNTANRGLRGGCYSNFDNLYARGLRSAYRYSYYPYFCVDFYGARLTIVSP